MERYGQLFCFWLQYTKIKLLWTCIVLKQHTFTKKDTADEEVAHLNSSSSFQAELANRENDCTSTASTSSAASSKSSVADHDEPKYKALKGDMSFDTFTEFQQNQPDQWSAFSPPFPRITAISVAQATGPMNFWSSFALGYGAAGSRRPQQNSAFSGRVMDNSEGIQDDSVGLDIDESEPVSHGHDHSPDSSRSYSVALTDTSSVTASPSSADGRKFFKRENTSGRQNPVIPGSVFFPPPDSTPPRC